MAPGGWEPVFTQKIKIKKTLLKWENQMGIDFLITQFLAATYIRTVMIITVTATKLFGKEWGLMKRT